MREAVIVAAKRTAFGKYAGQLKHLEPEQLLLPLFQFYQNKYPNICGHIQDVITYKGVLCDWFDVTVRSN